MDDGLAPISSHERRSTRRTFLAGSASLGVAAIAGCFGDDRTDGVDSRLHLTDGAPTLVRSPARLAFTDLEGPVPGM